jgi:hypothetical protein
VKGDDANFQTPLPPRPKPPVRQSPAAAAGSSVAARRGRPPGSVRGAGSSRARGAGRGGARPRRDWGGDDDDDEDDYQPVTPKVGRGGGGRVCNKIFPPVSVLFFEKNFAQNFRSLIWLNNFFEGLN